jgi:hypothetical protein
MRFLTKLQPTDITLKTKDERPSNLVLRAFSFIKLKATLLNSEIPFSPRKLAVAALVVFVIALSVRLLYFDDRSKRPVLWDPLIPTGGVYVSEAHKMVNFGFLGREMQPRAHARHILHPPGYLIYLIGVFELVGWDNRTAIMALQAFTDSVTTVLVLIFASFVINLRVGVIAGLLIAVSPHLAYGALYVAPESPFVLPVVLGVGSLYLAYRKNQLKYYLIAGGLFGLACWLRSNGLGLSPFFAILMFLISTDRKLAVKGGTGMLLVTALVISPITYRNYVMTGRFIPLSIGFGVILMQSVADYDFDKEYGLPKLDPEVAEKEAEWYDRPDYARHFLRPDGIDRDFARIGRTLNVIKSHPFYYLSTVVRRIDFILRYDLPSGPDEWPFNTATPVYVSKQALYGHGNPEGITGTEVWSNDGNQGSPMNNANRYTIDVEKSNDYVVKIEVTPGAAPYAWRVTNQTGEIELGAVTVEPTSDAATTYLTFPSQNNNSINVEVTRNLSRPNAETRHDLATLMHIGPTPTSWTDPVRSVVRGIQRNLYETLLLRILMVAGVVGLLLAGCRRELFWIGAIPLYFLMFQSLLHTEYRYILAAHYFLFVVIAVGLYWLWTVARSSLGPLRKRS